MPRLGRVNEDALISKLREVERELGRPDARDPASCRARLAEWRKREADIDYQCSIPDPMAQRVLLGVCLRYGLLPYRRSKRARATLWVRAPRGFMREVLWPEVDAVARVLEREIAATTRCVIERWADVSFAGVVENEPESALE